MIQTLAINQEEKYPHTKQHVQESISNNDTAYAS